MVKDDRFLLARRTIPPYKNRLCLPGGIVRRGEKIGSAIKRIGKDELGIEVKIVKPIGYYEKIYKNRHDITHCFIVKVERGVIRPNYQSREIGFFHKIPKETPSFFKNILQDAGFS